MPQEKLSAVYSGRISQKSIEFQNLNLVTKLAFFEYPVIVSHLGSCFVWQGNWHWLANRGKFTGNELRIFSKQTAGISRARVCVMRAFLTAICLVAFTIHQVVLADAKDVTNSQEEFAFDMASFSPDQSEWSDKARLKFEQVKNEGVRPLAVLKIDRLSIEGPIFVGTKKSTLDRGLGLVDGTKMPGETGNMALSGHRDSFFRPLKDVVIGDRIELQTANGIQSFEVSDISIVDSQDIRVLDPTDTTVLTLITCYPFYFVGYAPDRFIVRAIPVKS